jgi:hypothetical protein
MHVWRAKFGRVVLVLVWTFLVVVGFSVTSDDLGLVAWEAVLWAGMGAFAFAMGRLTNGGPLGGSRDRIGFSRGDWLIALGVTCVIGAALLLLVGLVRTA